MARCTSGRRADPPEVNAFFQDFSDTTYRLNTMYSRGLAPAPLRHERLFLSLCVPGFTLPIRAKPGWRAAELGTRKQDNRSGQGGNSGATADA